MLRKLVKYDLISLSRFLLLIHVPALFLAVIAKVGVIRLYNIRKPEPLALSAVILYFIYWSFLALFTQVFVAVYTYRNLFTREGYLTQTLPVKSHTLILSKLCSGGICSLASSALLYITLFFVLIYPPLWKDLQEELPSLLSMFQFKSVSSMGWTVLISSVVTSFTGIATVIGSICIGHLFLRHRILIAFISYFGINTLLQMVVGATSIVLSLKQALLIVSETNAAPQPDELYNYIYQPLLLVSVLTSLFLGIASYFFSCYVMKKRLNLD